MANLLSVCELAWRQVFPNPGDETPIKKGEFIATGKSEYAYQLWLKSKQDKREEGRFEVPSYLMSEKEMDVKDNEIDITGLNVLTSLENDLWLQNVGGLVCDCTYVRTTVNLMKTLCDDDSLGDNAKRYYVVGKKIKFPDGTHKDKLPIIFANTGENVDERIEIDDALAGIIRRELINIYTGKTGKEDKKNDTNPES